MAPLIMVDPSKKPATRLTSGFQSSPRDTSTLTYHDDHNLALDGLNGVPVPRPQSRTSNNENIASSPTPTISSLTLGSPSPTSIDAPAINLLIASTDKPLHDMGKNEYITWQIVEGTIGGVALIALSIVLFFLYRRRRERKAAPYAMGPLQVCLPMSKEAFTSPRYSHYGLSFSASAPSSTDSLTPVPRKSRKSRLNSVSS